MGVLLSRYPDMDAKQVRELMFTTANNKMSDGVRFLGTGQTSPSGASTAWTAPDGLPDERWGWDSRSGQGHARPRPVPET